MPSCPRCNNEYDQLGHHFTGCGYPELEGLRDPLLGIVLSDGRVDTSNRKNGYVGWVMTNKKFMDYIDKQLGWLTTGVRVFRTPKEVAENAGIELKSDPKTQYVTNTRSHPTFNKWRQMFYENDQKTFPEQIDLTDEIIKYWYIGDGTLNRGRVEIGASNYSDKKQTIENKFNESGYNATFGENDKITLRTDDSKTFFSRTNPVPGFEYKWPDAYQKV